MIKVFTQDHETVKQKKKLLAKLNAPVESTDFYKDTHEFYATPFYVTKAILDREELKGSILEPAAGEGHISKVLRDRYPNSKIVSTDIVERQDKWHCGIVSGIDFLTYDYGTKFDNVITNPPFLRSGEFAKKALSIARHKVLFLAKLQFLETEKRKELFKKHPPKAVYIFTKRCFLLRDGKDHISGGKPWTTTVSFAWFVWEKGCKGEPVIRWIN